MNELEGNLNIFEQIRKEVRNGGRKFGNDGRTNGETKKCVHAIWEEEERIYEVKIKINWGNN